MKQGYRKQDRRKKDGGLRGRRKRGQRAERGDEKHWIMNERKTPNMKRSVSKHDKVLKEKGRKKR